MLTVELVLIVAGWLLVVCAVLRQLSRSRGIRLRGRSTRVPTNWTFVALLLGGLICWEVAVQLGEHRNLGRRGFALAYIPILAFVAVTVNVHNRRLPSNGDQRTRH